MTHSSSAYNGTTFVAAVIHPSSKLDGSIVFIVNLFHPPFNQLDFCTDHTNSSFDHTTSLLFLLSLAVCAGAINSGSGESGFLFVYLFVISTVSHHLNKNSVGSS